MVVCLSPISDYDVNGSLRGVDHSIEDSIGEPQALTIVVDETSIDRAVAESSSHAVTVCHGRCHSVVAVVSHAEFGTVVTASAIGAVAGFTGHSGAGH